MSAFELNEQTELAARSCGGGPGNDFGEKDACIIAQKIFDQCRIQRSLNSDILGPARVAPGGRNGCNDSFFDGDIIVPPCNASDVFIRDLKLARIELMQKKSNPLQEGCWDLEFKYVFTYTLEFRSADGCFIGCIDAASSYTLRVTLFGSTEANVTRVTDLYDCCGNGSGPFAIAEGKAIALGAELKYPVHCGSSSCGCCCDCCNCCSPCDPCGGCGNNCGNGCGTNNGCGDSQLGAPIAVNISIGLFTVVKLFRTVNMRVRTFGNCVPEPCSVGRPDCKNPMQNFESMSFPFDLFSPSAEPRSCCGYGSSYGSPDCSGNDCGGNCGGGCDCGNSCGGSDHGCGDSCIMPRTGGFPSKGSDLRYHSAGCGGGCR